MIYLHKTKHCFLFIVFIDISSEVLILYRKSIYIHFRIFDLREFLIDVIFFCVFNFYSFFFLYLNNYFFLLHTKYCVHIYFST